MKTQKEFKCNLPGCGITFSNQQELADHKATAHKKIFKCAVIGCQFKGATRKENLTKHIKDEHPEDSTEFPLIYPEDFIEYAITCDAYGSNLAGPYCADGQSSSPPQCDAYFASQHLQSQNDPNIQSSPPLQAETSPPNFPVHPNAQSHGVWSNNNYQVGILENTPSSCLYTAIAQEQVAIIPGQSNYGYQSHSGDFAGPTNIYNNAWDTCAEDGGHFESSEDNYGGTNYTWGA